MANTVNGQTGALTDTQRERTGIEVPKFRKAIHGQVLRARVALDTAADFTIDDPAVAGPAGVNAGSRVYVVGVEYASDVASTVTFKSKVGAAAAVTLAKLELGANAGVVMPIKGEHALCPTDIGGALLVNAGTVPIDLILYYVIATSAVFD